MTDLQTHPYQQQVLDLFSKTSGQLPTAEKPDPSIPAKALAKCTAEAKDPSPDVYIWSTILAIHQHASSFPQGLDFMLVTFQLACSQFPDTVTNEYGHGRAAGLQQLKWWLVELADGFQGYLMPPRSIGSVDAADQSNLLFKGGDIDSDLSGVLSQIEEWRQERTSWIIAAPMQARCFSLEIVRVSQGNQIEALIDSGLKRGQRGWNKADFTGSCIMIRGCGRSLLHSLGSEKRNEKLEGWKSALEILLRHDEEASPCADFGLTYHASLALKNLRIGPKDETSNEIFATSTWLF